jgi:hypothetical protein
MVEDRMRGGLSYTPNDHRQLGSSGSGFEYLIKSPLKPDVPFGEQMSDEALEKYYNLQLNSTRLYLSLTPEQLARIQMGLVKKFKEDLSYLESRGIDTTDAKLVFKQLGE